MNMVEYVWRLVINILQIRFLTKSEKKDLCQIRILLLFEETTLLNLNYITI